MMIYRNGDTKVIVRYPLLSLPTNVAAVFWTAGEVKASPLLSNKSQIAAVSVSV